MLEQMKKEFILISSLFIVLMLAGCSSKSENSLDSIVHLEYYKNGNIFKKILYNEDSIVLCKDSFDISGVLVKSYRDVQFDFFDNNVGKIDDLFKVEIYIPHFEDDSLSLRILIADDNITDENQDKRIETFVVNKSYFVYEYSPTIIGYHIFNIQLINSMGEIIFGEYKHFKIN